MTVFAAIEKQPVVGDMVVTPIGKVGLVMFEKQKKHTGEWFLGVAFVNNGPLTFYSPSRLKRATTKEIEDAGLHGVGCNPP